MEKATHVKENMLSMALKWSYLELKWQEVLVSGIKKSSFVCLCGRVSFLFGFFVSLCDSPHKSVIGHFIERL